MQLRELVKKIRQEKKLTQVQLGWALEINQQDVQGMENAGRNLEKQFRIFLKLLTLCGELGIDPARTLKHPSVMEVIDAARDNPTPSHDDNRGTPKAKTKSLSPVPPRRVAGSQRKIR